MFITNAFETHFGQQTEVLKRLQLYLKTGTEHRVYSQETGKYETVYSYVLEKKYGSEVILAYKKILSEAYQKIAVPILKKWIPKRSLAGTPIDDRISQINLEVMGNDASEEVRNEFRQVETEFKNKIGISIRELCLIYINLRTGQIDLNESAMRDLHSRFLNYCNTHHIEVPALNKAFPLPLVAHIGGRTNIDGTDGVDKGWALEELSKSLERPLWTIFFVGDSFDTGGNDAPAAQKAGLCIDLVPKGELYAPNTVIIPSKKKGSEGLIPFLQLMHEYLNFFAE